MSLISSWNYSIGPPFEGLSPSTQNDIITEDIQTRNNDDDQLLWEELLLWLFWFWTKKNWMHEEEELLFQNKMDRKGMLNKKFLDSNKFEWSKGVTFGIHSRATGSLYLLYCIFISKKIFLPQRIWGLNSILNNLNWLLRHFY